ncbi:hypothetical protein QQP08_011199 [Theobroma cacao]|uniref:Uncharacterized protein n=1 Tax=Theobroma cacao TaxID=3641 RepID=A0A061FUV4_THECC|nr:Uncharacterized protein TCM_012197 [Theobroma cacao]WRX18712.1 hypothetical protein QQP08_011199 [Theobroma cacao]
MEDDPEPDTELHFFQNFHCYLKMDGIGKAKAKLALQSCNNIIGAVLSSCHWRAIDRGCVAEEIRANHVVGCPCLYVSSFSWHNTVSRQVHQDCLDESKLSVMIHQKSNMKRSSVTASQQETMHDQAEGFDHEFLHLELIWQDELSGLLREYADNAFKES